MTLGCRRRGGGSTSGSRLLPAEQHTARVRRRAWRLAFIRESPIELRALKSSERLIAVHLLSDARGRPARDGFERRLPRRLEALTGATGIGQRRSHRRKIVRAVWHRPRGYGSAARLLLQSHGFEGL